MTPRLKNQARCLKCGTVITSTHRHDFRYCQCKAIFVDGGNDYWRRGGEPADFDPDFKPELLDGPTSNRT